MKRDICMFPWGLKVNRVITNGPSIAPLLRTALSAKRVTSYDNSAASWLKALAISFNSKPIFLLSDSRHNTIQNEYENENEYENVWQAADVEADEAIYWSIYLS